MSKSLSRESLHKLMEPDSSNPPKFSLNELYKKRLSRDNSRLKVYNQILQSMYNRIRKITQNPGNIQNEMTFTIPSFIVGLPIIDIEDCVVYIVYQLRTAGFVVKYTYPSTLYVSWSHYEQQYMFKKNPIVKAMVYSKTKNDNTKDEKTTIKKGEKNNSKISLNTSSNTPSSTPVSAASYMPPPFFLDIMKK